MRFGVVIPVYNRPRMVLEALETVGAQTRPPDAVVVVDNGSDDGTFDAASGWCDAKNDPGRWRVLRESHRGAARARQTGYDACEPLDAVAFLDSDDLWPRDFLERAERALAARPDLIGVSADRLAINVRDAKTHLDRLAALASDPVRWMVCHDAGFGSCSVIRASAFDRIGGYPLDEPTGHDILLFTALFAQGPWGHLLGAPSVSRRQHHSRVGEADHIAHGFSDSNLRHARLYHRAAASLATRERAPADVRTAMARRWISAAKACRRNNDPLEGLRCLTQVHQYRTISLRATRLKWQLRRDMRLSGQTCPTSAC
tara:strand:- start:293 stop:1237 length:945 start_codon:yes stop_codon:yes gene_type:complete